MGQRILDTNRLIAYWRRSPPKRPAEARSLALEMVAFYGTSAIVTPVAIEFLGGTRDRHELLLHREFLGELRIIDQGRIIPEDLVRAQALAEQIPWNGQSRDFADCLIRAMADRLHYEVDTADAGMPRIATPPPSPPRRRRNRITRRKTGR